MTYGGRIDDAASRSCGGVHLLDPRVHLLRGRARRASPPGTPATARYSKGARAIACMRGFAKTRSAPTCDGEDGEGPAAAAHACPGPRAMASPMSSTGTTRAAGRRAPGPARRAIAQQRGRGQHVRQRPRATSGAQPQHEQRERRRRARRAAAAAAAAHDPNRSAENRAAPRAPPCGAPGVRRRARCRRFGHAARRRRCRTAPGAARRSGRPPTPPRKAGARCCAPA